MQEGKSEIEEQKRVPADSTINSNEVIDKVTNGIKQHVQAVEFEEKGSELPTLDSVDHKMQEQMKQQRKLKSWKWSASQLNIPMDLIASPLPKKPISSPEEKDIAQEVVNDDQLIEGPHVDFIFKDRLLILGDCVQMAGIQELKHQFIRARINTKSSHHKEQRIKTHLNGKTRSYEASTQCKEIKNQTTNRKFVHWIFDPGGHIQNLRLSSLQWKN